MVDLAAPAARQHQKNGRSLISPLKLARAGPQRIDLFDQGMPDISAGRTAKSAIRLGFKRQQRQHVIHVRAHGPGPSRPPCPHGRRDVIDDRHGGTSRARTRRATRCVKSGLSMITRISGEAAITASAVSRIRRRIIGNCFATAANPMIDRFFDREQRHQPLAGHRKPPTPSNRTASPSRCRKTFIRLEPSRSPDSSVAMRNIFRETFAAGPSGITQAVRRQISPTHRTR